MPRSRRLPASTGPALSWPPPASAPNGHGGAAAIGCCAGSEHFIKIKWPASWNLKWRIEVAAEGGVRGRTPPDHALRLDARDGVGANAADRRREDGVSARTICPAASALSDSLPRCRFLHHQGGGASYRAVLRAPRRAGVPPGGTQPAARLARTRHRRRVGADLGSGGDGAQLAGDLARR